MRARKSGLAAWIPGRRSQSLRWTKVALRSEPPTLHLGDGSANDPAGQLAIAGSNQGHEQLQGSELRSMSWL
jgi:hypothetical protein